LSSEKLEPFAGFDNAQIKSYISHLMKDLKEALWEAKGRSLMIETTVSFDVPGAGKRIQQVINTLQDKEPVSIEIELWEKVSAGTLDASAF
jgi:ABC-type microcin C transport system permease subunit YejB